MTNATTYTTKGNVCGGCGHAHRSIATALACADRHQAAIVRGNPGGRAYSDRTVARSDGLPLTEWERDEAYRLSQETQS